MHFLSDRNLRDASEGFGPIPVSQGGPNEGNNEKAEHGNQQGSPVNSIAKNGIDGQGWPGKREIGSAKVVVLNELGQNKPQDSNGQRQYQAS